MVLPSEPREVQKRRVCRALRFPAQVRERPRWQWFRLWAGLRYRPSVGQKVETPRAPPQLLLHTTYA
jgi:hypothetical protein